MRPRGRPGLGGLSGFFFGLSLAMLLVLLGAARLDTGLLIWLPVLFMVLGVVWGFVGGLSGRGPSRSR